MVSGVSDALPRSVSASASVPWVWRAWLGFCAWATLSGWILSAVGSLNALGYLGAAVCGILLAAIFWRDDAGPFPKGRRLLRPLRYKRALPTAFLLLGAFAVLGGALYPPTNYDTLWYRLPRVHYWLAEGRWHWIDTIEPRMNYLANGYEWLFTPFVAWTGGHRLIFLPNAAAFFLLPGLLFSLGRQVGVSGRVSWTAMWVVPAGWMYCLQAGSAANDAIAATFALACIDLALRARRANCPRAWGWSLVAAALLANVKQSNMALGLPWLIAWAPGWRLGISRPLTTATFVGVALAVSIIPITIANLIHTGTWFGWTRAEQTFVPSNPVFALFANIGILALHNLLPPYVPGYQAWNHWIANWSAAHPDWVQGFEFFGALPPSFDEAWAGLGPAVTLWLVLACWLLRKRPKVSNSQASSADSRTLACAPTPTTLSCTQTHPHRLILAGWIVCIVVFLMKMGCRQISRYLAPFVPIGIPFLLRNSRRSHIARSRLWNLAAVLTVCSSIAVVVLLKQRPLLPVRAILLQAAKIWPEQPALQRFRERYKPAAADGNPFPEFLIPLVDEPVVGYAATAMGQVFFWDPRSGRKVVEVDPKWTASEIHATGVRFVVINDVAAIQSGARDGLDWAETRGAHVHSSLPLSSESVRTRADQDQIGTIQDLAHQRWVNGAQAIDNRYLVEFGTTEAR